MIPAAILASCLALPLNCKADYLALKEFVEARYPTKMVVFVHEDEKLLSSGAEDTGVTYVKKPYTDKGLRIWLVRRAA